MHIVLIYFKQMEIEEFIKTISSVNGEIYLLPIVDCANGKIYEYDTIKHFTPTMVIFRQLKSLIIGFLDEFTEYKNRQHVISSDYISDHFYNCDTVAKILKKGGDDIKIFNNFKIEIIPLEIITGFIVTASSANIIHFIDHCNNINYEIDPNKGWTLLNYACNRISQIKPDVVKHLISRGADMTHLCKSDMWSPLFQIITFSRSDNLIKYAIDKHIEAKLSLNMLNSSDETIIERIFEKSSEDIILYALNKIIQQKGKLVNRNNLIKLLDQRSIIQKKIITSYLNQIKDD